MNLTKPPAVTWQAGNHACTQHIAAHSTYLLSVEQCITEPAICICICCLFDKGTTNQTPPQTPRSNLPVSCQLTCGQLCSTRFVSCLPCCVSSARPVSETL